MRCCATSGEMRDLITDLLEAGASRRRPRRVADRGGRSCRAGAREVVGCVVRGPRAAARSRAGHRPVQADPTRLKLLLRKPDRSTRCATAPRRRASRRRCSSRGTAAVRRCSSNSACATTAPASPTSSCSAWPSLVYRRRQRAHAQRRRRRPRAGAVQAGWRRRMAANCSSSAPSPELRVAMRWTPAQRGPDEIDRPHPPPAAGGA